MFGNSKDKSLSSNQERFDTLIGRTTEIVGRLVLLDSVRVDGKVHGSIESQADRNITVAIGPTGEVTGDIRANRVIVAGRVQGNIEASERAELQKDCVVMGQLLWSMAHGCWAPWLRMPRPPARRRTPNQPYKRPRSWPNRDVSGR
jgi:cytoskeletal protein CcmA (bactofilin family)